MEIQLCEGSAFECHIISGEVKQMKKMIAESTVQTLRTCPDGIPMPIVLGLAADWNVSRFCRVARPQRHTY
jgi:hypothetical protein